MTEVGRRVALVIGNCAYAHADSLRNPGNDAKGIAASLTRIGFRGIERRGRSFELGESPSVMAVDNLDYDQLRRALGSLAAAAHGAHQAVLYYAGHGVEVDGQNYLVPVDAELKHARAVEFEALPLFQAMGAVEGAKELGLVILDACRNNPFRSRLLGARSVGSRGLGSVEPPGNVLVAYAAKHGAIARDGIGEKSNSPFAEALLNWIEHPGLEIMDFLREVKAAVHDSTEGAQEPYWYGALGRARVYFVPRKVTTDPFRDANFAPLLIKVSGGIFSMGAKESEDGSRSNERPVHLVRIKDCAVGVYPVTVAEWEMARKMGFKGKNLQGGLRLPASRLSWPEARSYADWLASKTSRRYRLLSEAEWEYACRAGTSTPYSTGATIDAGDAWFSTKFVGKRSSDDVPATRPFRVGVHEPNQFGLHDLHGNVWEWVEDDYHFTYRGAPTDGTAWTDAPRSNFKVLRGGCYASGPRHLRSARRARCHIEPNDTRKIGFRIARDL